MEGVTSEFHKLTDKQKRFIEEYLMSFKVVEAYIKAGYSTNGKASTINKNAYQLLHSETIQKALAEQLETVKDNKEYVTTKLEKFFMKQIDNEEIPMKDRLKSAELLAKMTGAFEQKINVKSESDFEFHFNITEPEVDDPEEETE